MAITRGARKKKRKISKAARNERRKLTANLLNGIAIGTLLAGCYVPIFSLYLNTRDGTAIFEDLRQAILFPALILVAIFLAISLHNRAIKVIDELEDCIKGLLANFTLMGVTPTLNT